MPPLHELIELIESSDLSKGSKIAYLYLIYNGSFSLDSFSDLRKELEKANKNTEKKAKNLRQKISGYDKKIATLESEIAALSPKACLELQGNFDKLVEHASEEDRVKKLKKIKAKLSA